MDEDIGYSSEEDLDRREMSSNWKLAHDSFASLSKEPSKLFLQYQNYHLHLIRRKEQPTERRTIPFSKMERLAFFRNYVSSPIKTQIACMHDKKFNVLFWEYVMNTVFKSLQHTYVHIFLASYVPHEHLFISKMVPLMYGIKYCFILSGLLEVIDYFNNIIILLDYVVGSIFFKNPWNRCPTSGYFTYEKSEHTLHVNCYNVLDFGARVQNKTIMFIRGFYLIVEENELLQLVQIEYFRFRRRTYSKLLWATYSCIVCGLITLFYKRIYSKNFWKSFHIFNWLVISMDIASFVYLVLYNFQSNGDDSPADISVLIHSSMTVAFTFSDVDFLAESTTAPPVVHFLTARGTQEITPGRDSAICIISNALCFLFRALLSYRVKRHCESLAKVPILLPGLASNAWLYFWPMYFSTFFLGDLYTLVFLVLNFVMEIMTTVVTFQCLVEVIVAEWPRLRRWLICLIFSCVAIVFELFITLELTLLMALNKSTITLLECIALYWMYPVFRLIDDISFHYGVPIHFVRMQLLICVPLFYLGKYYGLINACFTLLLPSRQRDELLVALTWASSLIFFPLCVGLLYICYKYIFLEKKSWKRLFAPVDEWGPKEYTLRQLRKEYDTRTYNNSQAHKNLSRYIIGKADSKAYRLDIQYDPNRRSTVIPQYDDRWDK